MNRRLNLGVAVALVFIFQHAYSMPPLHDNSKPWLAEEPDEAVYEEPYAEYETDVEELTEVPIGASANSKGFKSTYVSPNRLYSGTCRVGPNSSDVIMKCHGFSFSSPYPTGVFCQTRQASNQNTDYRWKDQFACQIIETSRDFVRFRVRRIDDGTGSSGWGQNLYANLLIID